MSDLKVLVIVGSTRPSNVGQYVGEWYMSKVKDVEGMDFDLVQVGDLDLPFMDEPNFPQQQQYVHEHTKKWSEKVAGYDAYVWVVGEYNHGVQAPLKNALDYLFHEWVKKPVAFVGYGNAGGSRAVEHMRQTAGELDMHDVRLGIHIREPWSFYKDGKYNEDLVTNKVEDQVEQLRWWATTLKEAREKS